MRWKWFKYTTTVTLQRYIYTYKHRHVVVVQSNYYYQQYKSLVFSHHIQQVVLLWIWRLYLTLSNESFLFNMILPSYQLFLHPYSHLHFRHLSLPLYISIYLSIFISLIIFLINSVLFPFLLYQYLFVSGVIIMSIVYCTPYLRVCFETQVR